MQLNNHKINWYRITIGLLICIIFSSVFVKKQLDGIKITKLISSARQVSFWINDFSDSKKRMPKNLDELFEFSSNEYGSDADKVISDFKIGKVLYYPDANASEELIRWEAREKMVIVVTVEGRIILLESKRSP